MNVRAHFLSAFAAVMHLLSGLGVNGRAHFLSAFAAVMHLLIGLAVLLNLPLPRFVPPSWQVIYMVLGGFWWLYPALWTATGCVALAGIRWPGALKLGFRLSALLFLSWASAGVPAMTLGLGGNVQGASANLFTAGLAWLASYYVGVGERSDRIDEKIVRIADQGRKADGNTTAY